MQGPVIPTGRRRRTTGDGGETVLRVDEPPIYAELAARWRQSGRSIPGQHDREWADLVTAVPHLGL